MCWICITFFRIFIWNWLLVAFRKKTKLVGRNKTDKNIKMEFSSEVTVSPFCCVSSGRSVEVQARITSQPAPFEILFLGDVTEWQDILGVLLFLCVIIIPFHAATTTALTYNISNRQHRSIIIFFFFCVKISALRISSVEWKSHIFTTSCNLAIFWMLTVNWRPVLRRCCTANKRVFS
jgi:hypothetical protein